MKKIMTIILFTTFITPFAFAGKGMGKGGFMKILKQLELTDEQKSKLKEIRKAHKEDKGSGKEEIIKLRESMKEKFVSNASEAELRTIHNQMKSFRSERNEKRFSKLMKIRNVLTPEQRKKFQELRMENRGNRGNRKK